MESEKYAQARVENLPDEILITIFRYLQFQDILMAEYVCKKWYEICRTKAVWNHLVVEYNSERNHLGRFTSILENHCHLVSLIVFRNVNSYSEVRCLLNLCQDLTELRMYMCGVNNKVTKDVQNYSNLRILSIKNCYSQWGKIEPLTTEIDFNLLPKLEELNLTDFGLSDSNIESLISCNNLKCLNIEKIKSVSQENMMKLLKMKRDKLEEIAIYGRYYDDQIVECAMDCPKLTHLSIVRCEELTNVSIRLLQEKSHLKKLSLWNNQLFTPAAIEEFLVYGDLSRVNFISFSKIQHLIYQHLCIISMKCPDLKFIGIYLCPMLNRSYCREIERLFPTSKIVFEL